MVKYAFSLKIKGSNEEHTYVLDLTPHQENMPEQVFTPQICEDIRINLQNKSSCTIKDTHLNKIITTWKKDIKEGYRDSTITLNLRLLIEDKIDELNEQGNQTISNVISPDLSDIEPKLGMLPPLNFV